MRKLLFVLLAVMVVLPLAAQTTKNLTYDDPIYTFIDKCYAKGWIYFIPDVKPYTEKRAMEYLKEVRAVYMEHPEKFSDREVQELEQYMNRLDGNKFNLFHHQAGKFGADVNLAPHIGVNTNVAKMKDTSADLGSEFMIDLYLGENVFLGLRSDIYGVMDTWEDFPCRQYSYPHYPDFNMYTYNLKTGDKGFNHDALHTPGDPEFSIRMDQVSQVSVNVGPAHISVGRNSLNWGPGELASLSLSRTSKPYDYVFYDIPIGKKMYYSWMTGFLRDNEAWGATEDQDKLISSHRFEYQPWSWFKFSIYETVVYSQRFALSYLNPFSLYYISEVADGDKDNKFGGMDFTFRFWRLKIYLSLFLDDWDFDEAANINYYHNIGATTLGYKIYDVLPKFDLTMEYTYLSHWMYTHKLFAGDKRNSYAHYGSNLGHFLPTNSQMAYLDVTYNQTPNLAYGLSFWFIEHGYGNINTHAHDDGIGWDIGGAYKDWDGNYNFMDHGISGIVKERNLDWTLHGEYRIPYYGIKFFGS
ncbi:MAG: hypothetical protein IKT97_01610, partial [Spirochaetia bacterium]|nr:hypothetical protein [Spirochaetia bacterium]